MHYAASVSTMQAYLAEKYMSGPKAEAILALKDPNKAKKSTKKKRKAAAASGPSMFIDEDAGFGGDPSGQHDEEDSAEAVVASDRTFKKRRMAGEEASGWTTVRESVRQESPPLPADEQPVIVAAEGEEQQQRSKGGLLTSEQLRNALPRSEVRVDELSREEIEAAQETVYRDASGRKVDMKLARAEAARKKREKEEQEARKMEWGKGLVQREEEENRRSQLEKNRNLPFSRHADDKQLNEELQAQERWNDPAAAFLTVRGSSISDACDVFHLRHAVYYRRKRERVLVCPSTLVLLRLQTALGLSPATGGMA